MLKRSFLLILCALCVVSGCRQMTGGGSGDDPLQNLRSVQRQTITKTLPGGDVRILQVSETNGAVTVEPAPGDDITVRAERVVKAMGGDDAARKLLSRLQTETRLKGDVLVVASKYPENLPKDAVGRINYHIEIPVETQVEVTVKHGTVRVSPGAGRVQVKTANGPVEVVGAMGEVTVDTENGAVTVRDTTPEAHIRITTRNGDATVRDCPGRVQVTTAQGDVDYSASHAPGGDLKFKTENGDIDVTAPADAKLDVTARTRRGSIACSLPLHVDKHTAHLLRGRLNDPAFSLNADSVNGDIALHAAE